MEQFDLYGDISRRTGGNLYIGVVGPVRTGKSTFLTRFLQKMVLPNITDEAKKLVAVDELPQAGQGKTITTTEPKFLPQEGTELVFSGGDDAKMTTRVRLIDCVGYLVDGALGDEEEGKPRMVKTAWDDEEMPFAKAAELGTRKVIEGHATVAVLVTTDGSFTDIPRANYIPAEERVARELKAAGKPFVIVLNTTAPSSKEALALRSSMEEKYGVPVLSLSVNTAEEKDFSVLLERLLFEFPLTGLYFELPPFLSALDKDSPIISSVLAKLTARAKTVSKMKDYALLEGVFGDEDKVENPVACKISPEDGSVTYRIAAKEGVFYEILSEACGETIAGEYELMSYCKSLANARREYKKLKNALAEVQEKGYGIVVPPVSDVKLEEPELVRRGGGYGVRLKATAPSLHMMRVDVSAEINPVVGTEEQSREMAEYLKAEYERDPVAVWQTNVFGKTLQSLIAEGLEGKTSSMPEDAQKKMRKTVTRIVNEGKGGVLCILL